MTGSGDVVELQALAGAVQQALDSGGLGALSEEFHDDIIWGDCQGAAEATSWLANAVGAFSDSLLDSNPGSTEVASDRVVVTVNIQGPDDAPGQLYLAVFARDGKIAEICHADDRHHAESLQPIGPIGEAAARPVAFDRVAPVLPVRRIGPAVTHYRKLGFEVTAYDGDAAYGFAVRGDIELHLSQVGELDPAANTSAVYLYVGDADALFAAWRLAEVDGRLVAPTDTDYGLREGAHIDPDGNLLRFGSDL